ncbi:hypothetical protein N9Z79_07900 [Akkermansiaceae bacterium]|jgi:hypothetical protein|nr:hypothetical protein [Akkermansiaceae bacterium]
MPSILRRLLWSKEVPLIWCILVPTALTIGLAWLLFYSLSGDRIEILGRAVVPDHGDFQLGQTHDDEFGYILWAKTGNFEWAWVGWSLNGGENSITATSKSGRFHGIAADGVFSNYRNDLHDMPIVFIFDSTRGVLWPSQAAKEKSVSFWLQAWHEINENEPLFPAPPSPEAK